MAEKGDGLEAAVGTVARRDIGGSNAQCGIQQVGQHGMQQIKEMEKEIKVEEKERVPGKGKERAVVCTWLKQVQFQNHPQDHCGN